MRRRRVLQLGAVVLAGTAGCAERIARHLPGRPPPPPSTATPVSVPATEFSDRRPQILVRNQSLSPQRITISLRTNGLTTFSREETIGPTETVRYERVVAAPGTFRVDVKSTFDRRATTRWTVERPTQTLVVRFVRSGKLALGTRIRCPIDCGEFVVRARRTELSETLAPRRRDFPLPAMLVLQPAPRGEYEAGIRTTAGETMILDAHYRIPSESPLTVPLTRQTGRYDVSIEVDGNTSDYRWHVAEPSELHVTPRESRPNINAFVRPHPAFSPTDVISIHLAALANNDPRRNDGLRTVWRFGAPQTKRRFERFENFARVLGRPAYTPLFRFEQFEFGEIERQSDRVSRSVTVTGDDIEPTTYEFNLVSVMSVMDDDSSVWTTATFFEAPDEDG